jgi:molybdate transport system ATP-binding protein
VPRVEVPPGAKLRARIRAGDVMIAMVPPSEISALNVLAATVEELREDGPVDVLLALRSGADRLLARVTRRSRAQLELAPGRAVFAVIKAVAFEGYNAAYAAPADHQDLP